MNTTEPTNAIVGGIDRHIASLRFKLKLAFISGSLAYLLCLAVIISGMVVAIHDHHRIAVCIGIVCMGMIIHGFLMLLRDYRRNRA